MLARTESAYSANLRRRNSPAQSRGSILARDGEGREKALVRETELGHHTNRREAGDLSCRLGEIQIAVSAVGDEGRGSRFGQIEGGYRGAGTQATNRVGPGHGYPDGTVAARNDVERGARDRQDHLGNLPLGRDSADPASRQLGEIDTALGTERDTIGMAMRNGQWILFYHRFLGIVRQRDSADPIAGILGEPQAAVGSGDYAGRSAAPGQRELFKTVSPRSGTIGSGRDKDPDLVSGVFGEPDGPVAGGRDTCRAGLWRRHEVIVRLAAIGKDASDALALRIGEPYRAVARYRQALGKALEVQVHAPDSTPEFHQAKHWSAVLGKPDAGGARRDSVWRVDSATICRGMREGRGAGVAASLDPVAKLVHRGLRRRRTATGTARDQYRQEQRACCGKLGLSGGCVVTNNSGRVDGEPIR